MEPKIILIRQPGIREISKEDVRKSLDDRQLKREHEWFDVEMARFAEDVDAGWWEPADLFLRTRASEILASVRVDPDAEVHYFGMAEVPQMIALGAYIGLEYPVAIHDYNRDAKDEEPPWRWAEAKESAADEFEAIGLPSDGPPVNQPGVAIVRVEVSARVSDTEVDEAVGPSRLADIRIGWRDQQPQYGRLRALAQVESVRVRFRDAVARLRNAFPELETLHLFAPVPTSVAFAIGQELVIRNAPPTQTYRYRVVEGQPAQRAAILIRAEAGSRLPPLGESEKERAALLRRTLWTQGLEDVVRLGREILGADEGPWFKPLTSFPELGEAQPFRQLPQLRRLVGGPSSIDEKPHPDALDFHFDAFGARDPSRGSWRLGDRLVLGFARNRDTEGARRLVRLFFLHEYLHQHHVITGYTADQVGKFANVLEYVDYSADLFAIGHEFDSVVRAAPQDFSREEERVGMLLRLLDDVIDTFRVFQVPGESRWQVRRLRRHLNWHWQRARIASAKTLLEAVRYLGRKPTIELAGIVHRQEGRRTVVQLDRPDPTTELEMAVVLDNESVYRRPGEELTRLCDALIRDDVETVRAVFAGYFEHSRERFLS